MVTLPSAQLSHKRGATTCPKGLIRNVKVHPGSSDPPSRWSTWEEYLQLKPGEFTPDQIVAEMAQNWLMIDRAMARILKMFNWYTLPVWPDPPNDEEATHQGQIFKCTQKEWTAQVRNIREAAATEAAEADKDDDGEVNKGDSKQAKLKPKWATCSSKKKKKDSSLKTIKPPDDNLDEYFGLNQGQNSQETADVTPTETPKKSEEAKSKMILIVPVTEGWTDHLKAQLVRVHLGTPPSQNNLHDILRVLAMERSTDHLKAQLVKVHPGLLQNQSNLHDK